MTEMEQAEQAVLQQCGYFHSYCIEQMIRYWVETEPDPEELINRLISGWRERATNQLEKTRRAAYERTGMIDGSGAAEVFQMVLDEAEKRVRTKLFDQRQVTDQTATSVGKIG